MSKQRSRRGEFPALADVTRPVSRADLERRLAALRREVRDPRQGLFGPGTKLWEVNREAIVFLGAGRAALLQLALPAVAYAIDQHSSTRNDPWGRFQRTFRRVFAMVFGPLDEALEAARSVHAIHDRIRGRLPETGAREHGQTYYANEPAALLWVHATLWDTSIQVYEAVVRPLLPMEKERYYRDTRRFAQLFGVPDEMLPEDWTRFRAYVTGMLAGDELHATPPAVEMARFLLRPPHVALAPLMNHYALVTAHLLPARLAEELGVDRRGARGRRRYEATLLALRRIVPHLPGRVRHLPAYVDARRRMAGRTGWDPLGELLSRIFVGAPESG